MEDKIEKAIVLHGFETFVTGTSALAELFRQQSAGRIYLMIINFRLESVPEGEEDVYNLRNIKMTMIIKRT